MTALQQTLILLYGLVNTGLFLRGFYESKYRHNAFGLVLHLTVIGAFVWADAVIFGLFWAVVALVTLILNDWYLFWLIVSLFWVVRSLGETIYWLNQQFSTQDRNPIKNSSLLTTFHNDSIWFVNQILWQCVTVVAAVSAIYFGWQWIQTLS